DTVTLDWQHNGSYAIDQYKGGPYKYQAEGPAGYRTSWIHDQFARLSGSLFSLGTDYWWVRSRSCETDSSACWSPWWGERTVNVVAASALPPVVTAPWSDNLEGSTSNWRMSGLWRLDGTPAHSGLHSFMYNTGGSYANGGTASEGNLTSPPITIPTTGYWMRFWYRYQTENNTRFWDQRWVQVSIDGQPFVDLYQLSDDLPNTWLQSPPTSLASYAGHTMRFRFNFVTLDGRLNDYAGWFIDDLEVNTVAPPACGDAHEQNPQPGQATPFTGYGETYSGDICPNGDVDYYSFGGQAGQRVAATLTDLTALDPHISLLAEDGTSLLAESHGTSVAYELPRTGTYYVRVREWNHPSDGSAAEAYTLRLVSDSDLPQVTLSTPASDGFIAASNPRVAANVTDMGGVRYVEFFSHTSDWAQPWVNLGEDWNGADGWSASINQASLPETRGLAFYARAFDWGGHSGAAATWNVGNDRTPPTTSMTALAGTQPFSFFLVRWSGSDSFSGFDRFDVQVQRDGGAWQDWLLAQSATSTEAWYYGELGHSYAFRVRGRDLAGNQEAYPASPDTSSAIAACTT
ncbi:MAG: pre-peptidase C-terminal domain-containing protein, partial [Chloroflexi bacterium]|nr:pre-peptidase C-terminal domain-containing protein [Chloroflexota bacterium]